MGNIDEIGFQSLLYTVFITEKKYTVEAVCKKTGLSPSRFYSYTGGYQYFPPDLIPSLFIATKEIDAERNIPRGGEMRLWSFLMDGTGLEAVPVDRADTCDNLDKELLDAAEGVGALISTVRLAVEDGVISEYEAESIRAAADGIERELEGIKAKSKPGKL